MIAVTSRAMKEGRYVSSSPKGYSMLFCLKKGIMMFAYGFDSICIVKHKSIRS
jgi:hypothetical protein|tara:strand:+ start:304 stop:462 length:159 start_codon:yes stop_codon:yes gene_type:complete